MFWRADQAPAVVVVLAPAPAMLGSRVTLSSLRPSARRRTNEGLYLITADDRRLLVLGEPADDTPLALLLPVDASIRMRWRTAERALGVSPALDPLTAQQRRGHRLALRAFDGRLAGASDRQIAAVLFPTEDLPRGAAWKSDPVRARTLRLLVAARRRVAGAYRALLRLEPPRRRR